MLSYQKNKLINLILQFEQELNDTKNEIDDKIKTLLIANKFIEASKYSSSIAIIERNLQSIKTQLKKL